MSFQRTATKYTLQMEPSTAIRDATSKNTVSSATMLSLSPHQPHQNRLTPGFPDLCHNHSTNITISYTCDPRTKPCCPNFYTYSHAKDHPSVYTHLYTKCSTCATMTVRAMPVQHQNAWSQRCNWRSDCPWLYKWCTWTRTPMGHLS